MSDCIVTSAKSVIRPLCKIVFQLIYARLVQPGGLFLCLYINIAGWLIIVNIKRNEEDSNAFQA